MDRASRFQNRIPLSFNKPVQNGVVPAKPLTPLLLDRFRALVKEREDEIRVFAGGRAGLPPDEIVRIYELFLSELTINSKPTITDLTVIAGEQRAHAKGIADAICSRIIEVSVDQKIPSLYLLDSIVKNIGKDYIKYFSARLPEVFCEAYLQVHPNMHRAMRHLFGTWSTVFPSSVLRKIEAELQFSPSANGQPSGLSSSRASESPIGAHGIHVNPKYFGAQHHSGLSPADTVKSEDLKRPLHPAARIPKSTPYGTGHTRDSLSGSGIDLRHNMVMGREEDMEWQSRNWKSSSKQPPNTSVDKKYDNYVNLQGPRALISAYGIDEREKHLHYQKPEHMDSIGTDERVAGTRTWQNTEEEEFDWKDMGPLGKSTLRHSTNLFSSKPGHDSTSLVPSVFPRELISHHQQPLSNLQAGGTHNLHTPISGPSLMQTGGQFGINGNVDLPTYPNNLRPSNLHGVRPPNFPMLSSEPTLVPMGQGYVAPGRGLPAAWQSIPGTSFPGPSFGQNIGQVGPRPPGGALSGLLGSLMSQGLISNTKQDSIGVEFDQELLKVRHEPTITSLYGDLPRQCTSCGLRFISQEDHRKHMDWHVNKNRALKNRKTKPSPKFFVNVSMWLSGAEASGNESVPGFLQPTEDIVEKRDDEELAVPADEEQSTCALCGEPFDDFYSDETEEWMYKGAVYMYAPIGSTLGMDRSQLGPIVHAKCRSDSHGGPTEESRKNEWELAEEESHQRKRLRS